MQRRKKDGSTCCNSALCYFYCHNRYAGTRLSKTADQFADLTGLWEAMVGGVIIESIDSLAGTTTSITAAYQNHPELAISNVLGKLLYHCAFYRRLCA